MVAIPLNNPTGWHHFSFSGLRGNQYQVSKKQIDIKVNKSASPLIYSFDKPKKIQGFKVQAQVAGKLPKIPTDKVQGHRGYDDFIMRFGLIIKGEAKLNWLQRRLAPQWLVSMEKLLPEDTGIKEVLFFTTCQQEQLLNQLREHAMDPMLKETCLVKIKDEGAFSLEKEFSKPFEVLGLWIGADGDETRAKFHLQIKEIKLSYK